MKSRILTELIQLTESSTPQKKLKAALASALQGEKLLGEIEVDFNKSYNIYQLELVFDRPADSKIPTKMFSRVDDAVKRAASSVEMTAEVEDSWGNTISYAFHPKS